MNARPCPECGETLVPYATSCACGWRAAAKPKNANPVAYPDYVPKKVRLSWREQWFLDRGLPYEPPVVGNVQTIRLPAMREPGQDDEERDVA